MTTGPIQTRTAFEFPDIEAAYIDAYHSAIDEGRDLSRHRFVIKDATSNIVMELPFTEVLGTANLG